MDSRLRMTVAGRALLRGDTFLSRLLAVGLPIEDIR